MSITGVLESIGLTGMSPRRLEQCLHSSVSQTGSVGLILCGALEPLVPA